MRQLIVFWFLLLATIRSVTAQDVAQLLVDAQMPDGQHDLYLIDVNTGEAVNLTNTPDTSEESPRWIDRDTLLYFDANEFHLYLLDVATDGSIGEPQALAGDYSEIINSSVLVSPDGNHIAYINLTVRDDELISILNVVDLPDDKPYAVVEAPGLTLLDWTQDSAQLLYVQSTPINDETWRDETYLIALTGEDAELLRTDESAESHPYIVQEARTSGVRLFVRDEVLYDAAGSILAEGVSTAAWSPDGAQIAYLTTSSTLSVMDADGGNPHTVAENLDTALSRLYWSPNGTQIAALFPHEGIETKLTVYNVDTGDEAYHFIGAMPSWANPDWRP